MEVELNSLDWNVNELEHKLELEDMKRTFVTQKKLAHKEADHLFSKLQILKW